jgi:hypothetical protein
MAAVHLDLDAIEPASEPSATFDLDGRTWECKNRGAIPAFIVDGLLGAIPMRMDVLWRGLLVEGQADDFIEMLVRPDSPFDLERATKLAETLAEVILQRPTQRSRPSEPGPRRTTGTSKAGSSSQAARSKKRAS